MQTDCNDKTIKYLIIPMSYYITVDREGQYEYIIEKLSQSPSGFYNKYIFFETFGFEGDSTYNYSIKHTFGYYTLYYAILPISISEINSFRRVQKLIFESMILSNDKYDNCAFCGTVLKKEKDGSGYYCTKCLTLIRFIECEVCKKSFIGTYFSGKRIKGSADETLNDISDFYKQEKQHIYRNVVNMSKSDFICPHCGSVNKNKYVGRRKANE
jgi:predicted RNA-binding Zn-ribbon protein involved in translation (DUF1610 family)